MTSFKITFINELSGLKEVIEIKTKDQWALMVLTLDLP